MLEGQYWKRRLVSVTNEYKKWREISRKQIKNNEATYSHDYQYNQAQNSTHSFSNLNTFNTVTNSNNYNLNNNYSILPNLTNNNNFNSNNFNNMSTFTGPNYINTSCNNDTSHINCNSNYFGGTINMGSSITNVSVNSASAYNLNTSANNYQMPTPSKQMTFNNRCRSPSPGLFNDFDLYNFSSDTLFSTLCSEDQKDPSKFNINM